MDEANVCLGKAYRMRALVVPGDGRGRTLGFPTANLWCTDPDQLVPAEGVYAVRLVHKGHTYDGVGSIGRKPTFERRGDVTIEVHLFDVDMNLNDAEVHVDWIDFLRKQEAFRTAGELVEQMGRDCINARQALEVHPAANE